jgi:hypothetical protein
LHLPRTISRDVAAVAAAAAVGEVVAAVVVVAAAVVSQRPPGPRAAGHGPRLRQLGLPVEGHDHRLRLNARRRPNDQPHSGLQAEMASPAQLSAPQHRPIGLALPLLATGPARGPDRHRAHPNFPRTAGRVAVPVAGRGRPARAAASTPRRVEAPLNGRALESAVRPVAE